MALQLLKGQLLQTVPLPCMDLTGRTIVVTGANSGLGLDAAKHLYQLNCSLIILACRSLEKGEQARRSVLKNELVVHMDGKQCPEVQAENRRLVGMDKGHVRLEVWELDMAKYASVAAFARRCQTLERLDGVILNAGICVTEFSLAEELESTLTVNVVSTFLLAKLLLPSLDISAARYGIQPYICVVGSAVHFFADTKQLTSLLKNNNNNNNSKNNNNNANNDNTINSQQEQQQGQISLLESLSAKETANMKDRYNLSKLLVMLLVRRLAAYISNTDHDVEPDAGRKAAKVVINNVSPGYCRTNLFRNESKSGSSSSSSSSSGGNNIGLRLIGRESEVGARTLVHGVSAAGRESHGQYLSECQIKPFSGFVDSKEGQRIGEMLWAEIENISSSLHI